MDTNRELIIRAERYINSKKSKILDEQQKEFSRLDYIRDCFGLSTEKFHFAFSFDNDDIANLVRNEQLLFDYSCKIRSEWKIECFQHTYKYLSSPLIEADIKIDTLRGNKIDSKYERYFINGSIHIRKEDGFTSYNTLTANGMSAINLCFELMNSLILSQPKKLAYSVGYYETKFLLNNLAKSGIECHDLDNQTDELNLFNAFIIEPNKADLTLQATDFHYVEQLVKFQNNKLKIIILDISYQGLAFNLAEFLRVYKNSNVIIFVVRSLIKLDQLGLELTNGGIVEVFVPNHLGKLGSFIEKELNKFRNAHGSNLSFYEFCLIDNSLSLTHDDHYSDLVLNTTKKFYRKILNVCQSKKGILIRYEGRVPFIFIQLIDKEKEDFEKFFQWLSSKFQQFGLSLHARNSFGFRNLTVEYFGILETNNYIFKICPGVFKGINYYLMAFLLSEFEVDFLENSQEKID
ncbi:hypothetical protein GPX81_02075 [Streptococcus thermophilus]|uniref:hypothetical protein n=2 Tax=Bacteria TaxID=2 RepID=UPI0002177275|nr:hypothetical protein [Streptococcus thermophilus]MBW7827754.1 hypothetical protein [Streptococcus thermophilus]MCE2061485.1 hypothetical protein [Streptococcus thermophilus]MCE2066681.1 hypothetical protein [Streptococcus thermophilus]MCE2069936.1 hypothetical protein [Streptococcus thermophilus]MCE2086511.1 hypothetical protein [Streptococcus thermophilus]